MLEELNDNIQYWFLNIFITCFIKSMFKWMNKFTCPVFMVIPLNPWSCGNKFYKICCSSLGVSSGLELMKGKDDPPKAPSK